MSEATDIARINTVRATQMFGTPGIYDGVNKAINSVRANGALTNTVAPAITGTAQVGVELSVSTGTWTHWDQTTSPAFTYQWVLCDSNGLNGVDIAAATTNKYTPVVGDIASKVRCRVTATNSGETESVTTAATAAVIAAA